MVLQIDSRELGSLLVPVGPGGSGWGVVVYDSSAGGAGHVRELLDRPAEWLGASAERLWVSEEHDARCEGGCLDCLMTFDRQLAAWDQTFQRREALDVLKSLAQGDTPSSAGPVGLGDVARDDSESEGSVGDGGPPPAPVRPGSSGRRGDPQAGCASAQSDERKPSNEERLRRARERMKRFQQ